VLDPAAEPRRPEPPADADVVAQVIRDRRTSLLVDPSDPVPDDLVDRLIEAATWAPNHKRTWPWRFTVLTGDARARLGATLAAAAEAGGAEPAQVAKLRVKYLRSATVVLVWVAVEGDEVRRREDRDAVAAAVQNLLLTATAHGLGNYWATVADRLVPAVREVAGVGDDHDLVALVYLGWPIGEVAVPARPEPPVTRLS
jgi:nitroreductase